MADGDLLLLYTDGILERPGVHPAQGGDDLADAAAHLRERLDGDPAAQRFCDDVLARLIRSTGYRDDVTLLAVQRHPPLGKVELSLPGTAVAVKTTRTALGMWLAALGVDDLTATAIQHAVGEVVTNAVEHAYVDRPGGPSTVHVHVELTETGVVEIAVADHGRWRLPSDHPYRGMGLTMAVDLVDDVRIDRLPPGTTVRLRHNPNRAVTLSTRPAGTPIAPMPDEPFLAALTSDGPDAVLVVHGPVDVAGAVELRDQLRSITSNGTVSRSVDLSRVTLLASAGVHVLYEARDRSTAHHERLHLLAPRGSTAHHVLELVGLHPLEQICGFVRPRTPGNPNDGRHPYQERRCQARACSDAGPGKCARVRPSDTPVQGARRPGARRPQAGRVAGRAGHGLPPGGTAHRAALRGPR